MLFNKSLLGLILSLWFFPSIAQTVVPAAPLRYKPTLDFDQRFYYVNQQKLNVWGYRAGILFHDKYKAGVGIYYMSNNSTGNNAGGLMDGTSLNQRHYIGTIYWEPFLTRKKYWECSVVHEIGYGHVVNSLRATTNKSVINQQKGFVVPAGVGLSLNLKPPAILGFKPIRWVGINLCTGFRIAAAQSIKQDNYGGWYWSISGAIFLDRFTEDFHEWKNKRSSTQNRLISTNDSTF